MTDFIIVNWLRHHRAVTMFLVQSFEQLQQQVNVVRNHKFITNFYLDPAKHSVWVAKKDCYTEKIGETLFIVRQDRLFWNIFYSSSTIEQLEMDLQAFISEHADETMMFDVVGRDLQCKPIVDLMKELGCTESTRLMRMTRMADPFDFKLDLSVRKGMENDIPVISMWLHTFFDVYTEQIPYDEELVDYARQGNVLVCEENGRMAGFLIYEMNNTTLYLRYWFTHPDFRDKKVGSRLLRTFFEEGRNTKRQLFWVICSNENAIKRYRHYGFKEENMFDFVMRYN